MGESSYRCLECREVFRIPMACSCCIAARSPQLPSKEEMKCPRCGSLCVEAMPAWGPADYSPPSLVWEYECQACHHTFELPVPRSPSQEKEIKCPKCGGDQIRRVTVIGGEPLYNG